MTDSKNNLGMGSAPADQGSKRPHATIDLKATEVKSSEVKPGANQPKATTWAATNATQPTDTAKAIFANLSARPAEASASATATTKPADTVKPADTAKPVDSGKPSQQAKAAGSTVPETSRSPAKPTAAPVKSSGSLASMLSHAAAALFGGILAVFAAGPLSELLQNESTIAPAGGGKTEQELTQRLAKLEEQLRARNPQNAGGASQAGLDARIGKIDELATAMRGLSDAQTKLATENQALAQKLAQQGAPGEIAPRIAKLEDTLATISALSSDTAKTGKPINLAPVLGRMGDLEASVDARLGALRKSIGQDVDARLKPVEEAVETVKSTAARLDRTLAEVKTEQQRVAKTLEQASQQAGHADTSLGTLKSEFDRLKGEVDTRIATAAATAIAPVAGKVTAMETNLDTVVRRDADRQANAQRTLLTLELTQLRKAVEAGRPFAKELAEVKKLGGGALDLTPLEAQANQRLPTTPELLREFRGMANAVLDADAGRRADGSLTGEILARARSVIRVRKVSADAKGDDAEAVLARMEAALKEGDLDRIAEEAKKIPEADAAPAQGWLAKVAARRSVEQALRGVEDKLKSSLSGDNPISAPAAPKAPASKG